MKKLKSTYFYLLFIVILTPCKGQIDMNSDSIQIPESFKILDKAEGDLDSDGVVERVIVFDTKKETEFGTERQIYIYKNNNAKWVLWKKSIGAVLPSKHGGMMGDPFEGISIIKNTIVVNHFGGSRQKWNYEHRYTFQNGEFELIGATIVFGAPCDYFITFEYNLSTGKINYKKETENCENDTAKVENKEKTMKLETLPKMDGFYPGNNKLEFSNLEIYY